MQISASTLLETSSASETSAESCLPYLPPELIELILLKLWEAPQPLQERWALLKNIALVNRAWLTLVARVSCEDVHISSTRHAYAFLRLFVGRPLGQNTDDLFTTEGSRFANEVCRSITFYVDGSVPKESSDPLSTARDTAHATADDASNAIRLVLDTLPIRNYLPNLRHISFRYTDWDYGDVFAHLERGTFPQHVVSLSIRCSFSDAQGPDLHGSSLYMMALDWMNARDRDLACKTGKGGPGPGRRRPSPRPRPDPAAPLVVRGDDGVRGGHPRGVPERRDARHRIWPDPGMGTPAAAPLCQDLGPASSDPRFVVGRDDTPLGAARRVE